MSDTTPTILLDSCSPGRFSASWRFDGYLGALVAGTADQVVGVLEQAEAATRQGLYAVGFVAYEAARALNPHLPGREPESGLPLAWFALFRERYAVSGGEGLPESGEDALTLSPALDRVEHAAAVRQIHEAITRGESYQINYTFPLEGIWRGDPLQLYHRLFQAQQPAFGAYLDIGAYTVISASPELFVTVQDETITTRPMKGTAPRGRFPAEDQALAGQLYRNTKERAENLMIVDLLRNDLGQVARTGSVQAGALFEVESYPTVHQMTSTITAALREQLGIVAIFRALFPCGSVTGAPKRRSMELIEQLEQQPRSVYCGAIGYLAPKGEMVFSVAIRTLLLERHNNRISMGVGSGITWDARADAEYCECLNKAAFLQHKSRPRLLESLLLDNGSYPLLNRHLDRLYWSAQRLGYTCNREQIRQALQDHAAGKIGQRKTRLLLAADGSSQIESSPLQIVAQPLKLAVASTPVDPDDLLLYLKTEQRDRYNQARQEHPDADEVLLLNTRGELTEGSYHNLVLRLDGRLMTPPLSSGLLPGVMRAEWCEQGVISEQTMFLEDLRRADEIWLINAVRGWRRGELLKGVLP